MPKNKDQNNSEYGHFLRSDHRLCSLILVVIIEMIVIAALPLFLQIVK